MKSDERDGTMGFGVAHSLDDFRREHGVTEHDRIAMSDAEILAAWMNGAPIASLPSRAENMVREVARLHARALSGYLTGSKAVHLQACKSYRETMARESPDPRMRQFELGMCYAITVASESMLTLRDWVVAAIEPVRVNT